MTKITSLQAIAAALLACSLSAAPAQAGRNRTWVSGHGTDSGGCALAAPCRTFAFAIGQTAPGGEIDVLDPAGYGPVSITKAISIVNDGVGVAAIGVDSGNAITINAGPSDSVHLRGLTIEGITNAGTGIQFNTGGNLAIENCVVRGFTSVGIKFSSSTSSSFSVSNTIASNNGGTGIFVQPSGSEAVKVVLSKVITNNNVFGIFMDASSGGGNSVNVTIVDSEVCNNSNIGVLARSSATVTLRNVVASYNGTGLEADTATLQIAHSVVTGNVTGLSNNAGTGTLFSYGDNNVIRNTTDNAGLLVIIAMN